MVVAAGCVVLVARPALVAWTGDRTATLLVVFAALLVVGVAGPGSSSKGEWVERDRRTAAAVLSIGVGAFAVARLVGGGEAPGPLLASAVALNTLAAVAEEAFFRRFVYDTLLPGGTAVAVVGSALLFALVHLSIYGLWALPIDLAAGLVLSWQRLATGSWHVPAVTHAVANVLVVI